MITTDPKKNDFDKFINYFYIKKNKKSLLNDINDYVNIFVTKHSLVMKSNVVTIKNPYKIVYGHFYDKQNRFIYKKIYNNKIDNDKIYKCSYNDLYKESDAVEPEHSSNYNSIKIYLDKIYKEYKEQFLGTQYEHEYEDKDKNLILNDTEQIDFNVQNTLIDIDQNRNNRIRKSTNNTSNNTSNISSTKPNKQITNKQDITYKATGKLVENISIDNNIYQIHDPELDNVIQVMNNNYYIKDKVYTKDETDELFEELLIKSKEYDYKFVDTLPKPTQYTLRKIYIINNEETGNKDEYVTVLKNNKYEWMYLGNSNITINGQGFEEVIDSKLDKTSIKYNDIEYADKPHLIQDDPDENSFVLVINTSSTKDILQKNNE